MRLIVTTIVRDSPLDKHGFVYVVDWEQKAVVHRFQPPPPRARHDVPRSGNRGFRGITFVGDRCYIANHDSIFAYDAQWRLVDTISHPFFASIHEIETDGESIWVTAAGTDAVLKVSLSGEILEEHFLGEMPADTRSRLGIRGRPIDRGVDHRDARPETASHVAHPNGLSLVGGRPYVTLYRPGAVFALNPFELVWRDDSYYGVHSGRLLDGGKLLYLAASFQSEFLGVDLESGGTTFRVSVLGDTGHETSWKGRIQRMLHHPVFGRIPTLAILKHGPQALRRFLPTSRPGWSRGIAVVDEDYILGGSSSATISLINTRLGRIEEVLQLEKGIQHSIFAIAIDPRDTSDG